MSFTRIIPHAADGYIEAAFDGHEDWLSATQTIEQIVAVIDSSDIHRILLNFERVQMRVAVAEAPEIANFFHTFANQALDFGVIACGDERGDATIDAFAVAMRALGHGVEHLTDRAATEEWLNPGSTRNRRAG
tara:strand:- start:945 stop:1343 length:399 start_codon:yes stop_codon:yes gene_type:complete